jgi:hypothetical protein
MARKYSSYMKNQLDTPVLFLIYRRPDSTKKVFEEIRKARPKKLFIAADGSKQGEEEKCQHSRDIVMSSIDWNCEVKTLFRDKNLGCRYGVSSAIDWFFENVEDGIILEDDILPDQSFFKFCQELLKRYRDDERIMMISGNNFQNGIYQTKDSYYFSYYTHIWGWATWKRAWRHYNNNVLLWDEQKIRFLLKKIGSNWKPFESYWYRIFNCVREGQIDSWAYIWTFSCWAQNGLAVIPEVNLAKNTGFNVDATHTKKIPDLYANINKDSMKFPLRHPKLLDRYFAADRYTDKKVLGMKPVIVQGLLLLLKIPSKIWKKFKTGSKDE